MAIVDGRLWSSGTRDRVRTARLRDDPECTLFVFEDGPRFLTIETIVEVLDGPDVPRQSVELFRVMQGRLTGPLAWYGRELEEADFRQQTVAESRVIYQFEAVRAYGLA